MSRVVFAENQSSPSRVGYVTNVKGSDLTTANRWACPDAGVIAAVAEDAQNDRVFIFTVADAATTTVSLWRQDNGLSPVRVGSFAIAGTVSPVLCIARVSPDGTKILFQQGTGSSAGTTYCVTTAAATVLWSTNVFTVYRKNGLGWLPDSSALWLGLPNGTLAKVRASDGTRLITTAKLTAAGSEYAAAFALAADGGLYFIGIVNASTPTFHLYRAPADGSSVTQQSTAWLPSGHSITQNDMALSPSGDRLALSIEKVTANTTAVAVLDFPGLTTETVLPAARLATNVTPQSLFWGDNNTLFSMATVGSVFTLYRLPYTGGATVSRGLTPDSEVSASVIYQSACYLPNDWTVPQIRPRLMGQTY